MELKRTRELLPDVIWRESSGSTNADLRELSRECTEAGVPLSHGTMLVTANQTSGRGRLDRQWITPPGTALAVSVLVRGFGSGPDTAPGGEPVSNWDELGPAWLPLIAGSAVQAALQPMFTAVSDGEFEGADELMGFEQREVLRVGVKWPNDVHVRDEDDAMAGRSGKKLCGILCELLPDGSAIVGVGINLLIPEWELPTDRATSLLAAGAVVNGAETFADEAGEDLADRVLEVFAEELFKLTEQAAEHPEAVRNRVLRHSLTIGSEVRVHLPGGDIVDGRARGLAEDGSLIVDLPTGGELTVSAGDVEHLR